MLFTPYLLRTSDQADITIASELSQKPTMWAIPDLLPCHRLSAILAPSGTGLSTLAYRLLASIAPAPTFLEAPGGAGLPSATAALAQGPSPTPDPARGYGIIHNHYAPPPDLDTTGFAPEDLIPNPDDPDWDPMLPLVPAEKRKPQPVDPVCPTAMLITFRDDPDVLRPKLLAAGVDPDRVLILSEMSVPNPDDPNKRNPEHYVRPFALEDAPFLQELLHEYSSVRLVLIDNADLLTNAQKRPTRHSLQQQLLRLHYVAQLRAVSITLLAPIPRFAAHPCKSSFLLALQEACREVYLLAPALPGEAPDQRYLFHLKHTYPSPTQNLLLSPVVRHTVPQPRFTLPAGFTPTDLSYSAYLQLRRRRPGPLPLARLQAMQFLTELLAAGPLPVGDKDNPPPNSIRAQLRAAGLSWGTLRRAAADLNLRIFRDAEHWYWQLPAHPAPALASATCAPLPASDQTPTHSVDGTRSVPPPVPDLAHASCAPSSSSSFILPPSSFAAAP